MLSWSWSYVKDRSGADRATPQSEKHLHDRPVVAALAHSFIANVETRPPRAVRQHAGALALGDVHVEGREHGAQDGQHLGPVGPVIGPGSPRTPAGSVGQPGRPRRHLEGEQPATGLSGGSRACARPPRGCSSTATTRPVRSSGPGLRTSSAIQSSREVRLRARAPCTCGLS